MTTISIRRVVDGELTSADSASLQIQDSSGATIVSPTVVAPSSAGIYSYTTTALAAGLYTATWTFTVTDFADAVVVRVFEVEAPVSHVQGVTLAEIERAVARLIGPYKRLRAQSGSTTSSVVVTALQSSVESGDYEDLYLLRRGRDSSGALIENFSADDRQRIVATYTESSGSLVPDRAWTTAPAENEMLELHYFDPEEELRPAVLQGLRRCYFEETLEIATTSYLREINLTNEAFWITRPAQVRRVLYGRQSYTPSKAPWFEAYQSGGNIWLRTAIPNVGTVRVTALRPHFTFVNNEDSYVGPDSDDDVLAIDLIYAMRAGHMSAWEFFPAKLAPVAAQGLALPMKQVADAFTLASMAYVRTEPEIIQLKFGQDDVFDSMQIGNL